MTISYYLLIFFFGFETKTFYFAEWLSSSVSSEVTLIELETISVKRIFVDKESMLNKIHWSFKWKKKIVIFFIIFILFSPYDAETSMICQYFILGSYWKISENLIFPFECSLKCLLLNTGQNFLFDATENRFYVKRCDCD